MPPAAAPPTAADRPAAVPYRCVCGGTAPVRPAVEGDVGGGECPACGRHITAAVLEDAGAETIRLPTFVAWAAAADHGGGFDGLLPDPPAADAEDAAETLGPDLKPDELPPGAELGHFRLEAPLGRGGMGAVYRALDLSLQRFVAVKVIRPDRGGATGRRLSGSPGDGSPDARSSGTGSGSAALDRLLEEARAQARVNHPNVVHVYFVSPDPAVPFLAMELVEGPTLANVLKRGPLPYGAVTRVGGQIAGALACAARYDIVHGDVKPANVLLAGSPGDQPDRLGTVKLSDFGLARRAARGERGREGPLSGTPNYLAPEVVRGGPTTAKSDLYALGVTLFEMTFGRLPYTTRRQTVTDRLGAHVTSAPEFPDPWPRDLPPGWRALLAGLLAKDPADRPADAAEAAAAIDELAPQSGTRAGLMVRALGWGADFGPVALAGALLFGGVAVPGFAAVERYVPPVAALAAQVPLALLSKAAGCLPSVLLAWWQARTGATPGKRLLQVRVVDRYGLRPPKRALFLRGLFQTLPSWGLALGGLTEELTGQRWLEQSLDLFVLTLFALDLLPAPFRADRRAVHDLILGTRVVLDTGRRS